MEEASEKVQKTSTHIATSCVAANGARVKGHGAVFDGDAAALHPEKGTSIQRGDGAVQMAFEALGARTLCKPIMGEEYVPSDK